MYRPSAISLIGISLSTAIFAVGIHLFQGVVSAQSSGATTQSGSEADKPSDFSSPTTRSDPSKQAPFAFIFIDNKTEQALGPFPYDRSVLARAINRATRDGARGVILKFFLDQPRSASGDRALADAMSKTDVVLEARLDNATRDSNPLPKSFGLAQEPTGREALQGDGGWLPTPEFAGSAYDLGFVDYADLNKVPIVECYQHKLVKSLALCCMELALEAKAVVIPGSSVRLRSRTIPIDDGGEISVSLPKKDTMNPISFIDLLNEKENPQAIKDRVVIIGYDSDRLQPIQTPMGPMRPHRFFCYGILSLYTVMKP